MSENIDGCRTVLNTIKGTHIPSLYRERNLYNNLYNNVYNKLDEKPHLIQTPVLRC